MNAQRYMVVGCDGRGMARGGSYVLTDLAAWVEKRFNAGWTKLTVQHVPTRCNAAGQTVAVPGVDWPVVAEIRASEDGKRVWWSE